jgi:D-alanyl-D-alanine carboxypeptidase
MPITDHALPIPTSDQHIRPARRRRRKLTAGLAVVAAVAAAATPTFADDHRAPLRTASAARLQQALDDVVAAGAPGALVFVRSGNETIRLSSGNGSLSPGRPMRVDGRARIGGVTKSFTATVVLQLAGQGRLALDDTVDRWLPGVIPNGEDISVRQ